MPVALSLFATSYDLRLFHWHSSNMSYDSTAICYIPLLYPFLHLIRNLLRSPICQINFKQRIRVHIFLHRCVINDAAIGRFIHRPKPENLCILPGRLVFFYPFLCDFCCPFVLLCAGIFFIHRTDRNINVTGFPVIKYPSHKCCCTVRLGEVILHVKYSIRQKNFSICPQPVYPERIGILGTYVLLSLPTVFRALL